MLVDIISDTVCPWCYIGKRRFERAVAESGRGDIMVAWRPFQLNPDMPSAGMARQDYLRAKFGGGDRPRQIYRAISETGREEGIDFQFDRIVRTPNTVESHRLIHWSGPKGFQDAVVDSLFRAYFEEGRDIGDRATLLECAVRAGMDAAEAKAFIDGDEIRQDVVQADMYARRLGINGVPCFVVNRKYAISGAQPPAAFIEVFNLAAREEEQAAARSESAD
ncbi:MAG: DsbA family oxidoreductase [Rhodospirillales bacterium]|nr:MAG: DsbA family oxidoreductase [Rhodospirillales bacterium]